MTNHQHEQLITMRLRLVLVGAAIAIFALASASSKADDYPSRNITLMVPSAPGGGTETQARILAPKLS